MEVDLWWGKVTMYGETGLIYGPQYVFFTPKAYELVTANSTRHFRDPSSFCFLSHIYFLLTLAAAFLSTLIIIAKYQA
jgi:hypothetical protein